MPDNTEHNAAAGRPGKRSRILWIAGGIAVLAFGALFLSGGEEGNGGSAKTFTVARGDLEISVLEGGNLTALESQDIRSEVKGHQGVKILRIVEEGYVVTEEDIANGIVLVELDSSDLTDRFTNQKIVVQSAEASYIEALQNYEIQVSLNESTVKLAELTVKFALMDFEKFLGEESAREIMRGLGLDQKADRIYNLKIDDSLLAMRPELAPGPAATESTGDVPRDIPIDDELIEAIVESMGESGRPVQPERFKQMLNNAGGKITPEMAGRMKRFGIDVYAIAENIGKIAPPEPLLNVPVATVPPVVEMELQHTDVPATIDFSRFADLDRLEDGDAKQQLRKLKDDLIVAREEYVLAKTQLDGKKRLAEKDFVTQSELDAERVKVSKRSIDVDSAETALHLYKKYEFPKEAETHLSEYEDALMELERIKKTAVSLSAQASAKLKSAESKHSIERKKYLDLEEQIGKCVIRATRPGLVVYGGNDRPWDPNAQIQEGSTVRQQQMILQIPDLSRLAVEVKVHESAINRVARGQKARIRIDQEYLQGKVVKVAGLPDSQNRWSNPDVKLFTTTVQIDGMSEWMRPGMSAEVEILVDALEDVLYVPLQAVFAEGDDKVCYVASGSGADRRLVETGAFTENFVEILDGLAEGENVYLRVPDDATPPLSANEDAPAPEAVQ